MADFIYFDNGMTTRPSERSISKMLPFLQKYWGVPYAPHQLGFEVSQAITESFQSVYDLVGANPHDHFVLTSSGAEAINQVIQSLYFDQTLESGRNHFITSNIDEAPAIMAIGRLEQLNCVGKMAEASSKGVVTAQAIAEAMTPRTVLVSLAWANGLTGVIHPVKEISKVCEERGVFFHLDASHILGKLFFDLDDIAVTHLTFSGDLLHAPKGTGGLFIRKGRKCSPLIVGGIEQAGLRAGSYSTAGLAALGEAAREMRDAQDYLCTEIARLRDLFESKIVERLPEVRVLFQEEERLPNLSAIAFPGIFNEALLYALNQRGLYACIGGGSFQQIAIILAACGVPEELAKCSISFNLSRETTGEEVERAVDIVVGEVKRLRNLSAKLVVSS